MKEVGRRNPRRCHQVVPIAWQDTSLKRLDKRRQSVIDESSSIPEVEELAQSMTSRYLSDTLKAETGRTAKDSVATIPYAIGFECPHVVPLRAGVAYDPARFAAAGVLTARGVALWTSANAMMQRVAFPAMVRLSTSVVPAATIRYSH